MQFCRKSPNSKILITITEQIHQPRYCFRHPLFTAVSRVCALISTPFPRPFCLNQQTGFCPLLQLVSFDKLASKLAYYLAPSYGRWMPKRVIYGGGAAVFFFLLGPGRMIKRWLRPRNGGGGIWRRRQGRISCLSLQTYPYFNDHLCWRSSFGLLLIWPLIKNQLRTH